MEKRTVVAIILIFLIYWFSSQYLWKPAQQNNNNTNTRTTTQTQTQEYGDFTPTQTPAHIDSTQTIFWTSAPTQNDQITIENDKIKLIFTNKGALLSEIILKEYMMTDKETLVSLIPENQQILQMNLATQDRNLRRLNDDAFHNLNDILYDHHKDRNTITFSLVSVTGTEIKKIYTLGNDYHLDMQIIGQGLPYFDGYNIEMLSGINITEEYKSAKAKNTALRQDFKFIAQIENEQKNATIDKLNKADQNFPGRINWAAIRSKYFVMSIIPMNDIPANHISVQKVKDTLGFDMDIKFRTSQTSINHRYGLYLGPVILENLQPYKNDMENIAELGWKWLRPLAKLFMFFVTWLYKFIPNYGIVIIIFAFILKVILTPLTNKSLNSTRKMQQIQPLMRDLQAKYKNDIKTQQEELRKLYKEHGVSPLGGCLPILLQMPIFFSLYPVLRHSIELRQAHFVGWLYDLSIPDTYYILPIIMGIFMFIQQKMMQPPQNTENMDEKQLAMMQSQKMMSWMMPPLMIWIFSGLPSGLVLYWTTFNVFSIVQQYYLNKKTNQNIRTG